MAENSEHSAKPGRQRTTLGPDETLQILQQAVIECQRAGIEIGVKDFYNAGKQSVVIVLSGVMLAERQLMLARRGE